MPAEWLSTVARLTSFFILLVFTSLDIALGYVEKSLDARNLIEIFHLSNRFEPSLKF